MVCEVEEQYEQLRIEGVGDNYNCRRHRVKEMTLQTEHSNRRESYITKGALNFGVVFVHM